MNEVTSEGEQFPQTYDVDLLNSLTGKGLWGADASLTKFCSGMGSDKEIYFTQVNDSFCAYPNSDAYSYIIDGVFEYEEPVNQTYTREPLSVDWCKENPSASFL